MPASTSVWVLFEAGVVPPPQAVSNIATTSSREQETNPALSFIREDENSELGDTGNLLTRPEWRLGHPGHSAKHKKQQRHRKRSPLCQTLHFLPVNCRFQG